MKKIWALLLIVPMALVSCSKDDDDNQDTKDPLILELTINEEDYDHDVTVAAGSDMHVEGSFSDNERLGEYKLDIHDNFDGHDHGKTMADWATVVIIPLSGKKDSIHEDVAVPSDATAGPYHAVSRLIDAEGNESDFIEHRLLITNGSEPMIDMTSPDPDDDDLEWEPGMTYDLMGTISDAEGIDEVLIKMEEEQGHDHNHGKVADTPLFEADFDLGGVMSWDFQADGMVSISIPSDAEHADYVLSVMAKDINGNWAVVEAEIHIH